MSSFILLKTFVQIRLACGGVEFLGGCVLLANGRIRFSLEVVAAVKERVKRMKLLTHPEPVLAGGLLACHETNAAIGGHADTVEEVVAEVFTMRVPGLSRTIRSPLDFEDRRTLRLNGDQKGGSDGKNLIAEIKHHFLLCH